MATYFLPSHVYFCCRGDAVVFLNLRRDEYSMLSAQQLPAFRRLLSFFDESTQGVDLPTRDVSDVDHLIDDLTAYGLLTTEPASGKGLTATCIERPLEQLISPEYGASTIRMHHVWWFFFSCAKAAVRLRFGDLEATVDSVKRRKALKCGPVKTDVYAARDLVSVFNRLRSLFPTNYLCLFDSLALIEFLAHYRIFPSWIFGVRPELWAAHCWVQDEYVVFNEDVEETDDYVPIMAV